MQELKCCGVKPTMDKVGIVIIARCPKCGFSIGYGSSKKTHAEVMEIISYYWQRSYKSND